MSDEKTYQWDSPHDWLADAAREWTPQRLFAELMNLATLLDPDDLQGEYQDEMAADGYFIPEGECLCDPSYPHVCEKGEEEE